MNITRALEIPANHRTGTIADVEHVVILTQENRSFDHYFGTMQGVRGFADLRAVKLASGRSVFHQPNGSGYLLPFQPDVDKPWHDVSAGPAAWLERFARRVERGPLRSMGAQQGCNNDDLSHPKGHPVPLRAGGRFHRLRCLSLLGDGPDRS
jgi:hypothetical protein